jgi:flagellar motor switch/type III secretory pathway protein FliN
MSEWSKFQDLPLAVEVEVGRARLSVDAAMQDLREGAVLVLDDPAGAPLHVSINGRRCAIGEAALDDGRVAVRLLHIDPT